MRTTARLTFRMRTGRSSTTSNHVAFLFPLTPFLGLLIIAIGPYLLQLPVDIYQCGGIYTRTPEAPDTHHIPY